ncbi:hypothetical protein OHA72_34970 [Dactylosporangium sp. NBC_01737]|uniref:hypothetical protein n=1 Tax=Dactylosporangium sp. NBC_01737 TaxID=2975959 RepID=UPI002E128F58|nr:hypothetical protein OHA72_34970 [Dactylosporangium sp. NBC_01737]
MTEEALWAAEVAINAWSGESVRDVTGPDARAWILGQDLLAKAADAEPSMHAEEPPDERAWEHPDVGWGVVLPWTGDSAADQARLVDAPAAIRRLAEARAGRDGPVVLRYQAGDGLGLLRRVYRNGDVQDIAITGGRTGTGPGQRPAYLLMVGSPEVLPWDLQCRLNLSAAVGRLCLPEPALERYVDALLDDWAGSAAQPGNPVLWATDYDDITDLMRVAVAEQMADRFSKDPQTSGGLRHLSGAAATLGNLSGALAAATPSVVITTSHGRTGPLGDPATMARDLGLLVDAEQEILDPAGLLQAWQPDGAIWYAHACCSAGSDATTRYTGLVSATSKVAQVLDAVAGLGARIAPLPTALLSAQRPARAFIGHVEPTFNWTLERPETQQIISAAVIRALWTGFFQRRPEPVGLAFRQQFRHAAELFGEAQQTNRNSRPKSPERQWASIALLTAYDRQSTVILGDPTVCPAALPP